MFRHMPVPRDTSVLRDIIVCCESMGNCPTLSKDGPSQIVNIIIFRPFFFSFYPMDLLSYLFLSCSEVRPPRVLYIVCMFINRQLFISRDIQSCDYIFGFHRKG